MTQTAVDTSGLRVSVVVASRNEARHIRQAIESVLASNLPPDSYEIIVADGMSSDQTRAIVQELAQKHPCVRLIDNPRLIAPTAFNAAIRASRGRAICIISAHSCISDNYLRDCLDALDKTGADVVGGPMITQSERSDTIGKLLMAVLSSRFGVGGSFRTIRRDGPADTVVFGVYRREVFERIGLFDERLVRNQDNELNSRLRAGGGKIWMISSVSSVYWARPTIRRLLQQNFRNGLYGMLTWRVNPRSFIPRHAIPLAFVLYLCLAAAMTAGFPSGWFVFLAPLGLYLLAAVASAVSITIKQKLPTAMLLPGLYLALHVTYGVGTLCGIAKFGFARLEPGQPPRLTL